GPFRDADISACASADEVQWAVSSMYAACADLLDGVVQAAPLARFAPARTLSGLGRLNSVKLAGGFLATAGSTPSSRYPATITVTNLRSGHRTMRVRVPGFYGYALGGDGRLVLGTGRRTRS